MKDRQRQEQLEPLKRNERILVVDDDENILRALERLLGRVGYNVITVGSGEKAIALLAEQEKRHSFGLLIVDLWMTGMSGIDVLTAVAKANLDLPTIALTGSIDQIDLAQLVNTGLANRILFKPWDDTGLLRIVMDLIESNTIRRHNQQLTTQLLKQQHELHDLQLQLVEKQLVQSDSSSAMANDTVQDLIALVAFLLDARCRSSSQNKRVAQMSSLLATARGLPEKEVREVEAAALLKEIAVIALPEIINGNDHQLPEELRPLIANEILKRIQGFENIAEMVRQLHGAIGGGEEFEKLNVASQILLLSEKFDQEMYPTRSPTAAQTSKAIKAHEEMTNGETSKELVQIFRQQVLPAYLNSEAAEIEIEAYDLEPGMVLARDVFNVQGVLLLSADTELDRDKIQQLRTNAGFSPLLSRTYVRTTSISVAEDEDTGSTLSTTPDKAAEARPQLDEDLCWRKKPNATVVVIDDDASVLAALKRELTSAGYLVLGFTNPEHGLEYIQNGGEAMAIISDYMMPGMLGSTLLQKIQHVRPELPCIVITAHATQDTINRIIKSAQMVRLLKKPWDKKELLRTLETFSEKR